MSMGHQPQCPGARAENHVRLEQVERPGAVLMPCPVCRRVVNLKVRGYPGRWIGRVPAHYANGASNDHDPGA